MSTDDRDDRAASFDRAAAVYQATRPSYPDDAVRWSVPAEARDVLDLAAGTGKLTERLVALGWHVVAVEPSDAMRAELTSALPTVEARPGTAERMDLPDALVDAVTIAQALTEFHPSFGVLPPVEVLTERLPGNRHHIFMQQPQSTQV